MTAERNVKSALALLGGVRKELGLLASSDAMTDGSKKVLLALDIFDELTEALQSKGLARLRAVHALVKQARPHRSDEMDLLLETFLTFVRSPRIARPMRERKHEAAGEFLAEDLLGILIGSADVYRNIREELPSLKTIEKKRGELVKCLTLALEQDDRNEFWAEATLRAAFRVLGVSARRAENMTRYLDKRAKKLGG